MNGSMSPPRTFLLRRGFERLRASAIVKQSLLVFTAGMVVNVCGFLAHAIASRQLGVTEYGGLYALINAALIASLPAAFVAPVVAQLAAEFRALHDDGHLRGSDRQHRRRICETRSRSISSSRRSARFRSRTSCTCRSGRFRSSDCSRRVTLFVNALRAIAQGTQDFVGYGFSNAVEGIAKVVGISLLIGDRIAAGRRNRRLRARTRLRAGLSWNALEAAVRRFGAARQCATIGSAFSTPAPAPRRRRSRSR